MTRAALLDGIDFPAADRARWEALAAKTLDGAALDTLASRTEDGIAFGPIHERRADAAPIPRKSPDLPWRIVQRIDDPDVARAARQAREDVEGGATGLALVFEGAPSAYGFGLPATADALAAVLDGIDLSRIHLRLEGGAASRVLAEALVRLIGRKRVAPARLSLSFGIDPAAVFAGTGRLRMSIEALEASMPQSLAHFTTLGVPGVLLEGDGRVAHNAGATAAQELGLVLAVAVGHLRLFEAARQPLVYAAPLIGFSLCVDQDQFGSIAKLRAMRRLWSRALLACGVPDQPATIHAESSLRTMTALDAETNILRLTVAGFAAAVGGADSVALLPHTIAHGLPDPFARRIARNAQLILADEAHVGFVADPAAGSGAVEALTEALCEAAWAEFQAIEREGGALRGLAAGHIQARIRAAAAARAETLKSGETALVGVTKYRAASERPVAVLETARRTGSTAETAATCEPLEPIRLDALTGAAS